MKEGVTHLVFYIKGLSGRLLTSRACSKSPNHSAWFDHSPPDHVTCKNCLRTKAYRAVVERKKGKQ